MVETEILTGLLNHGQNKSKGIWAEKSVIQFFF
jgi:hypothetical protein